MVHESLGPVGGLVSQNCVCNNCPPGALKQHRSVTTVVFWQLSGLFVGQDSASPLTTLPAPSSTCAPPSANFATERNEGTEEAMAVTVAVLSELFE